MGPRHRQTPILGGLIGADAEPAHAPRGHPPRPEAVLKAQRGGPPPAPGAGRRVYWAEDALDDQFLIRQSINQVRDAPQVSFCGDGAALLQAVERRRPDLAVLDINMPVLDGIETLRRLRRDPATADLPVVIFSTARNEADVAACKALGVLGFLQKPGPFDQFAKAVAGILALAGGPPGAGARAADVPQASWGSPAARGRPSRRR